MARDFSRAFYHSKAWKAVQASYMRQPVQTKHGTCPPLMCERCFELTHRLVPAEIVHHKIVLSPENIDDPDVTLNTDNLMRVCRDCHAQLHSSSDLVPRVAFDEQGRVIPIA